MQRIFAVATLKSIDSESSNLESRVLTEVEEFITQAEKFGGQSFKINDLVNIYHYNIVSSLIFGKRFKHGDATLKRLIELISEAITNTAHQAPTSVLPCLRFLPGDKFKVKRHWHVVDGILDIMQKAVDEHKKIPEEPNSTDIIYSFFKEQERRKQNNEDLVGFTDRDLLIMGYGLLFGGLGAPHTLQWSVLYLMHYPEVVSRMQKEIEENIENDRFPNMENKPRLPFCQGGREKIYW
ncbi:cytochrome P450 2D28-like [Saccostrea cucullata]|uniref:cytochrome P450 2D28-like n=1 Tax=Saccostrea cuccullata TaxID=36930 RepID=UPI002ED02A43